jgi:hypothetical protein
LQGFKDGICFYQFFGVISWYGKYKIFNR